MRRVRSVLWVAGIATLTLGFTCEASIGSDLDIPKLESEILAGIEQQTGVDVASVECPDDVQAEAGNVFTCTANLADGRTESVTVTQNDDEGNVDWRLG